MVGCMAKIVNINWTERLSIIRTNDNKVFLYLRKNLREALHGTMNLKLIHWNIKHNSNKQKICDELTRHLRADDSIVCLQEVTPKAKDEIIGLLARYGTAKGHNYAYSLDYRHPSKYDGINRQLGVLILCSYPMYIVDCNVLHRTPFPDRTISADILYHGEIIRVMSLHSITGCSYSKAKSSQYYSFAEAIDDLKPDIVTIDANEPKIDHYEVEKMEFYDNHDHGDGAKTFFRRMVANGLSDAFVHLYNARDYVPGKHLTTSIKVNRKGECRYDFMYIKDKRFAVSDCRYLYKEGIEASSDHALIVSELSTLDDRERMPEREDRLIENCFFPYDRLQEKHLIKYCRYYGHPEKCGKGNLSFYEKCWIDDIINHKANPLNYVEEHDLHILETFFPEDGVPLGIKAILFNRYCHWSSYSTIDSFKEWYLKYYIGASYLE